MSESVNNKLQQLQKELETLANVKSQMEKAGKVTTTLLHTSTEAITQAARVLTSADDLRASTSKLIERTDAIDFEKWLGDIRKQLTVSLDEVATTLKEQKLAVVKSIQDQYEVISRDQKSANEQQQQQMKKIEQSLLRKLEDLKTSMRNDFDDLQRKTNTKLSIILIIGIIGAGAAVFAALWPFLAR